MATPRWLVRSLAYVLMVLSPVLGQTERAPEVPWKWAIPPHPVDAAFIRSYGGIGFEGDEVVGLLDLTKDGKLSLVCGYPQAQGTIEPEYRAVVFDKSGQRSIIPEKFGMRGTKGKGKKLGLYVTGNEIPPDSIAFIGVEVLDAEGWSQLSSSALNRYRAKGIQTLPFPALDHPYAFELTTADGKTLTSEQFRGKVLVIQCWATPPQQEVVAALKALCQEVGEDRLAVVGINLDPPEMKKEAVWFAEELQMTWPQVFVLPDQEKWSAWHDIATISIWRLPTFVIDQSGILRANARLPEDYDFVRNLVLAK